MITESDLIRYIKIFLGQRFSIESQQWYLDVINTLSLPTFSRYYPKYVRNILITEKDAILSYNPTTRQHSKFKYKIPNHGEDVIYLDVDNFYHPYNDRSSSMSGIFPGGNFVSMLATSKVLSALPHVNSLYTVFFESPDILIVHPIPHSHVNFTVDMKCVRPLNQIMPMYRDDFYKLCLLDIKIALYNKYINLRSSGNFGGMELNPMLDDFSSAESDRESLLEKFKADSPKQYNNMISYFNKINY